MNTFNFFFVIRLKNNVHNVLPAEVNLEKKRKIEVHEEKE